MSARLASSDDRDLRRDPRPDPLEGGQPGRPESLVEGQVRLDRRGERPGGLDQQAGEPLDPGDVRREAGRELTRIRVEAEAQDRAHGSRPGRQPVEVRLRHWGAAEPLRARGRRDGGRRRRGRRSSSGTNQPGRDSPSRPETSVRSVMSLTVQSGAVPSRRASLQVDDLAADVEERDRVAVRRPDRRPRRAVVGHPQELAPVAGIEDHDVVAEAAGLGRRDVPAIGRERGFEVAGPGQGRALALGDVVPNDHRRALRPVTTVADVEQDLAIRPPGRILVAERRRLAQRRDLRLLGDRVVELEDDVALRRIRPIRDHGHRVPVGRQLRLADPGMPDPAVLGDPAVQEPDGIAGAVRR